MSPSAPAPRPILIYDGDCGLCTRQVAFAERRLRPRAAIRAYQEIDPEVYGLSVQECEEAVRFVDAGGRPHAAQDAVARLLLRSAPGYRPLGVAMLLPGVHLLAGLAYRWVARNRHRLPGGTPACSMPAAERPGAR